ncbi:DASH complex subunit Spc34 [Halenospora varia]|nr:DASH complex subunit Spc34 [Halenospora varia]
MSLLSRHLEQITLSADAIVSLPFPPPKIFTNALLSTPDITSLIRDTEPHERALFSVPPPPPPPSSSSNQFSESITNKNRRQTVFNVAGGEVSTNPGTGGSRVPRRNTAVAAVLGQELHGEVRRTEGKGEIDIEVLLRGVEKLNAVYEVRGVHERIHNIRAKYGRLMGSVEFYERKVQRWEDEDEGDEEGEEMEEEMEVEVTDEDLRREEEEIRELERRKKELEERVTGMERDLGGLLR